MTSQQMEAFKVRSEAAAVQDDARLQQRKDDAEKEGEDLPTPEGISLRQRAAPFIDMLQRTHKADKEIVWGV